MESISVERCVNKTELLGTSRNSLNFTSSRVLEGLSLLIRSYLEGRGNVDGSQDKIRATNISSKLYSSKIVLYS